MIQTLYKKLGIAAHEKARVKLAWFMRFLYQIGFVVSWTIITALFVERFGIENLIWLFFADAALFLFSSILVSLFHKKIRGDHYLIIKVILTLLFLFLASLFEKTQIEFFIFAVLAKDLFFSRINISLLRQTEEFFSPQEAQRFIPIIDSSITIGTIAGAFLMIELLRVFPEESVLWLWGMATAVLGIIALRLPKILNFLPSFEKEKSVCAEKNRIISAWSRIQTTPFLKTLLVMVLLQSVVFTFIEYEFTKDLNKEIVTEKHEDNSFDFKNLQANILTETKEQIIKFGKTTKDKVSEVSSAFIAHEKLAHDLGAFHLLFGIISLFVQIIITSRVLNFFGVVGSITAYFGLLFVALGGLLFGYGNMNVLRGIQHGFHSIGTSAYHLAFYSLFSCYRDALRFFLEGIIVPLGVIFSVGIMYFVPYEYLYSLILSIVFVLILVLFFMKNQFTKHSVQSMREEENISAKIHHIEILGQRGHANAGIILAKELKNTKNNPIIREKIISTLSRINDPRIITTYTELLNSKDETTDMKEIILKALLKMNSLKDYWGNHAFSQHHLIEVVNTLFENTNNAHLKKLIIMNIFQHIPVHKVVPFFLKEIENEDEIQQSILLRSCTLFDDPATVFYLRSFLDHSSPRLRGAALIALWKFEEKHIMQPLLEKLLMAEDEPSQISGIYSAGEIREAKFISKLLRFLDSPSENVRLHTLIALAKLGDTRSIPGLLRIIFSEDKSLSRAAFHMLDRVPSDIRYLLQKEIQLEVSNRVFGILRAREVFLLDHLKRLPKKIILELKNLYKLAERYDDMLIIEQVIGGTRT